MILRHDKFPRVVRTRIRPAIQRFVGDAVRQRLHIAGNGDFAVIRAGFASRAGTDEILDALALDALAIDVEYALDHLNAVARQTDHALDVILGIIAREFEDGDISAFRVGTEDSTFEKVGAPREGVPAVAIAELRDEKIVADQQSRDHRAGGNIKGLIEKNTDKYSKQKRMDNYTQRIHDAAALRVLIFHIRLTAH
jgi:hypothetical protein